jgi:hypothetical protein
VCCRVFVVVQTFRDKLPSPAKRCSTGQSLNGGEGRGVRAKTCVPHSRSPSPGLFGHPLPESVRFCDAGRSRGEGHCRVRSEQRNHPGLATTPCAAFQRFWK